MNLSNLSNLLDLAIEFIEFTKPITKSIEPLLLSQLPIIITSNIKE
jgi:hypothetical protein